MLRAASVKVLRESRYVGEICLANPAQVDAGLPVAPFYGLGDFIDRETMSVQFFHLADTCIHHRVRMKQNDSMHGLWGHRA